MPAYGGIERGTRVGRRTAKRLLQLRARLDAEIPKRTVSETLMIATWNIRELDSPSYGTRSAECMQYIAEIIDRFDLVAVQEVKSDLDGLERLRALLGSWWRYVVTDVTEGRQGNGERLAYLYDSRKVKFSGVIGEIVVPSKAVRGKLQPAEQLARTPLICGFEAGWYKFELCTVHVYYGKGVALDPKRLGEIQSLAKLLAARAKGANAWSENLILLGDFNIFDRSDATYEAIKKAKFFVPKELEAIPGSNVPKNKHYDQIAFLQRKQVPTTTGRAGVFDFFETVFRNEDEALYVGAMGAGYANSANPASYYRTKWRTYQMSDHLPMWVELRAEWVDDWLRGSPGSPAGKTP